VAENAVEGDLLENIFPVTSKNIYTNNRGKQVSEKASKEKREKKGPTHRVVQRKYY
jgi:hypothetical protein